MKYLIVLVFFVALASAIPMPQSDGEATILKYDNDNVGIDGYNFAFETSNGISQQQSGKLKNVGTENDAIEVNGSYSYTDGSGKKVTVTFVANENGYLPQTVIS